MNFLLFNNFSKWCMLNLNFLFLYFSDNQSFKSEKEEFTGNRATAFYRNYSSKYLDSFNEIRSKEGVTRIIEFIWEVIFSQQLKYRLLFFPFRNILYPIQLY